MPLPAPPSPPAHVAVGMSGGVDSSVTAFLLREQGYEVTGVTMRLLPSNPANDARSDQAIADARAVAAHLHIAHHVIDLRAPFAACVVGPFAREYQAGRTPNPCVHCNEKLKFGALWDGAQALGAQAFATGHFARITHAPAYSLLQKGLHPHKDQSYFLFRLSQEQLRRTLFPLGGFSKQETRAIAHRIGLPVAAKAESQEICFIPANDYKAFLREHWSANGDADALRPGFFCDTAGKRLGAHDGVAFFTIGQRKGLPGGAREPLYVLRIDPESALVTIGSAAELLRQSFWMEAAHWHACQPVVPGQSFDAVVKIRHGHPGVRARVTPGAGGRAWVELQTPQKAVTPGQAAVCYGGQEEHTVLGGGWIV